MGRSSKTDRIRVDRPQQGGPGRCGDAGRRSSGETEEPQPSIREIAREIEISPFHFIRLFEALFGLTPHQFRINARIDQAKRLLAQDRLSVTEVCMQVGLASLGSFSELFIRRVGTRPSEYQRRTRTFVQVPGRLPARMIPGCVSLITMLPDPAVAISEKHEPPTSS